MQYENNTNGMISKIVQNALVLEKKNKEVKEAMDRLKNHGEPPSYDEFFKLKMFNKWKSDDILYQSYLQYKTL